MDAWQRPETIALWIAIIALFVVVLVVSIILLSRLTMEKMVKKDLEQANAIINHQNELAVMSITIQEMERKRIAADIHDSLISRLTALQLGGYLHKPYEEQNKFLGDLIMTARRISHNLNPPLVEFTPLDMLLEDVIRSWEDVIDIRFRRYIEAETEYNNDVKIQILRVAQELMTNVVKHASATNVLVGYRETRRYLVVYIMDNGIGMMKENVKGMGLKNIGSRVRYLGGTHRIKSFPGRGTSVIIVFNSDDLK